MPDFTPFIPFLGIIVAILIFRFVVGMVLRLVLIGVALLIGYALLTNPEAIQTFFSS